MEWTPPPIISDSHRTHTHATPAEPAGQDLGAPTCHGCILAAESRDTYCQDLGGNLTAVLRAVLPSCHSTRPARDARQVSSLPFRDFSMDFMPNRIPPQ